MKNIFIDLLAFGALFFYKPFTNFVGTNRYLGIAFVLIGIGNLSSIYFTGEHVQKKERDYRRKARREKYKKEDPYQ